MMQQIEKASAKKGPLFSMRGDVNGLILVLGVLIALMLLPGPTEAEFKARDIQMNNIVTVDDLKK